MKKSSKNGRENHSKRVIGASCEFDAGKRLSPEIDTLVKEIIGRVADKWTMLVLEVLEQHGEMRFTQVAERVGSVSQKMLTKTLRQMERDGLVIRTVHPVVPPRVEYRLTALGKSLGLAFCGVWLWAEKHYSRITKARNQFDAGKGKPKS